MLNLLLTVITLLSFGIVFVSPTETVTSPNSTWESASKTAESRDKRMDVFRIIAEYTIGGLAKYIVLLLNYDIGYYLFTPRNPADGYSLKPTVSSLTDSPFNSEWKTKFIIHGYQVHLESESVFYDIKDELLRVGNYNVIVVDWSEYNQGLYPVACINGAITGLDVANLIYFLMENAGINAKSVHIIGHSLGGHVAGFAGKTTPNLGRISGLDAAGPIFRLLPNVLRLYHTDALFVDAIHTNGVSNSLEGYLNLLHSAIHDFFHVTTQHGCTSNHTFECTTMKNVYGYGTLLPYGDIDFFPNGGSTQTGCTSDDTYTSTNSEVVYANTTFKEVACSHGRAPFLFLESIRQCNFLSVLCDGYDSIRKGECLPQGQCPSEGSVTANMGFHAKPFLSLPPKSTFFLRTKGDPPFCMDCNKTK